MSDIDHYHQLYLINNVARSIKHCSKLINSMKIRRRIIVIQPVIPTLPE